MSEDLQDHFTLWQAGRQRLELAFDAPLLVSDAGLLTVRLLDRRLGVLDELAQRIPDPRALPFVHHSTERLLVQQVYQLLAGCPDGNDAEDARQDALFQILAGVTPAGEEPLASGSTLNRFQYAYTRKADQPDRPEVLLERRAAQLARIKIANAFLVDLFIRTRPQPPAEVVLDIDATDDPVHGNQALSGYHGHYEQHQYFPLLVFEGHTGFPLACWLRPGVAHGSWGAVAILEAVVRQLRAAWPGVNIQVRADSGLAVPEVYDFCDEQHLGYAIGFGSNAVLERAVASATADIEVYYASYGWREPHVQRFEEVRAYQAGSWDVPRRVVAKIERMPQGSQRRFVVTNLCETPEEIYRDFYVQRGAVPEQPIGELKNGLQADRLSAHGFCANAWRLLLHVVAYALVVLVHESCAAAVATASAPGAEVAPGVAGLAEMARASVGTWRGRLWKVPALVEVRERRVVVRLSATWPHRELLVQVLAAVVAFTTGLGRAAACEANVAALPM